MIHGLDAASDRTSELALLPALADWPRAPLMGPRTPLEHASRLGERLGIDLLLKRDDAFTLALGGNKVRQLEYYFGQVAAENADTVLITGAVQSNFVRLCAAAARKTGRRAVVQLEDRTPKDDICYRQSGNVLLNQLLGAEIHHFPEGENEAAADANLDLLAEDQRRQGHAPYVVHLGIDHPPYGGLGYALGAVETYLQCQQAGVWPDHVVIASGSGLTHAGFLVGARAIGWAVPVHGICVRRDAQAQHARITRRAHEINGLLNTPAALSDADVLVDDAAFGSGYGHMTSSVSEAILLAARDEALILDPVYTGRSMAGLIAMTRDGRIQSGQTALYVHTGGTPGIFAYQTDLTHLSTTKQRKTSHGY